MNLLRPLTFFILTFCMAGVLSASNQASGQSNADRTVKIALLHIAPSLGEMQANTRLVAEAMRQAKELGAQWVMTPELALTGYKFANKIGANWISDGPDQYVRALQQQADALGLVLFLSHLEKDPESGNIYNTLFVIDRAGEIIGRHRKINTIPVAEDWSHAGDFAVPVEVDGVQVGLLICADAWPPEHTAKLASHGAEIILSSAVWPPGTYGPKDSWEKRSSETGLALIVNNRTGVEQDFDMRAGQSVVAISGHRAFEFQAAENNLILLSWNLSKQRLTSEPRSILIDFGDSETR